MMLLGRAPALRVRDASQAHLRHVRHGPHRHGHVIANRRVDRRRRRRAVVVAAFGAEVGRKLLPGPHVALDVAARVVVAARLLDALIGEMHAVVDLRWWIGVSGAG